jgi:hypothetical protein
MENLKAVAAQRKESKLVALELNHSVRDACEFPTIQPPLPGFL